jgi:stage II sporulation protein D
MMVRKHLPLLIFILILSSALKAQVRVRLFSGRATESVTFTVTYGNYEIEAYGMDPFILKTGETLIISRFEKKIAVKARYSKGFFCDSITVKALSEGSNFSLRTIGNEPLKQYYSGDLNLYPDLETLVIINICDIEQYVAGVVRAEGGTGKNQEYFKTQAVLVRTYLYKYFDKHISDGYNMCDNTHCQVFSGFSNDVSILSAAKETHNLVILDRDTLLIISAFHSNCGGETAAAEDVWLTNQPYLKRVVDPYCTTSRNAKWRKSFDNETWINYLKRSGFKANTDEPSLFNYIQNSRLTEYKTGDFTLPLRTMRSDLNLRSSFFSVIARGDSVILNGKGYGHGVGVCQEGAMVMAAKGFNYKQILDFYFTGILISDIKSARIIRDQ